MNELENETAGIVERINPLSVPPGILSVHIVRYEFAAAYCAGMTTLDIACGAGYGSSYLSERAAFIVGGDADRGAIGFAHTNYSAPNLRFEVMDALRMPFRDGAFERIVSFETIEHLTGIETFLAEVVRVLGHGGMFIVSTPLVPVTNHRPMNPHHTIEFSLADFRALLDRFFGSVEVYGQSRVQTNAHRWLQRLDFLGIRHAIPSSLRKSASHALGTVPYEEMGTGSQRIRLNDFERAHDMVAVCSAPRRAG